MAQRSQRPLWVVAFAALAVLVVVGVVVVGLGAVIQASGPDDPDAAGGAGPGDEGPGAAQSGSSGQTDSGVAPRSQSPRPDRPLALRIQSYALAAPDRLRVRYTAGVPECYGAFDHAAVEEKDTVVEVTLVLRPVKASDHARCPEIAMVREVTVSLDQPLGDRRLLDGSTGKPVRRGSQPL